MPPVRWDKPVPLDPRGYAGYARSPVQERQVAQHGEMLDTIFGLLFGELDPQNTGRLRGCERSSGPFQSSRQSHPKRTGRIGMKERKNGRTANCNPSDVCLSCDSLLQISAPQSLCGGAFNFTPTIHGGAYLVAFGGFM